MSFTSPLSFPSSNSTTPIKKPTPTPEEMKTVLYKFVYAALSARGKRENSTNYNTLIGSLSKKNDPDAIERWYTALSKCTSLIYPTADFRSLTKIVFSFDWKTTEGLPGPLEAYTNFVINLSTSSSFFVVPILQILVKSFLLNTTDFIDKKHESAGSTLSEATTDTTISGQVLQQTGPVERLHDIVHLTINRIHKLIPSSSTTLMTCLVEFFPHQRKETLIHLIYVKNMLRISENIPILRDSILTAIIERLIKLDVEITPKISQSVSSTQLDRSSKIEEEQEERDDDDGDDELVFSLTLEDEEQGSVGRGGGGRDRSGSDSLNSSMIGGEEDESKKEARKILMDKLDALMGLLFDYLKLLATRSEARVLSNEVFGALLRIFDRSILRTHKSRFTQYLIYFFCNFKNEYSEKFLERLFHKMIDEEVSIIERQSAASYIASFIVRSTFLRRVTVVATFENLIKWITKQSKKPIKNAPGTEKLSAMQASVHGHIYSCFQAVMYIFTHRFESIADQYSISTKLKEYDFVTLLNCRYDPLKYCSQVVVMDFTVLLHELMTLLNPTTSNSKEESIFDHHESKRKTSDTDLFPTSSPIPFSPLFPSPSPPLLPSFSSPTITRQDSNSSQNNYFTLSPLLLPASESLTGPLQTKPQQPVLPLSFYQHLSIDSLDSKLSTYQVDYFFPFDPYTLPLSLSYLENIYYQFPLTSLERFNKLCKEYNFDTSSSSSNSGSLLPSSSPFLRSYSSGSNGLGERSFSNGYGGLNGFVLGESEEQKNKQKNFSISFAGFGEEDHSVSGGRPIIRQGSNLSTPFSPAFSGSGGGGSVSGSPMILSTSFPSSSLSTSPFIM